MYSLTWVLNLCDKKTGFMLVFKQNLFKIALFHNSFACDSFSNDQALLGNTPTGHKNFCSKKQSVPKLPQGRLYFNERA